MMKEKKKHTESGRSSGGVRLGLGKTLVIAQFALSRLVLVGAGLFVRTLANLRNVEMGFNPENTLIFSADPRMLYARHTKIWSAGGEEFGVPLSGGGSTTMKVRRMNAELQTSFPHLGVPPI